MPEEFVDYQNALPLKTMLHEYRLESVLGAGGFGITYLAWDTNLEKHVAIKEYMPGDLAMRALDGSVVPVNTDHKHDYQWGLDRFIQEARTLAKFSHPNIVRVNRYFEGNGTSYMVMEYEQGESLHRFLKRAPTLDEDALTAIVMPILDGLQAVHRAGFLHRDIKPSNVFIRNDSKPVLLDFGSSRFAAGGEPRNLTAIVSPGYAPLEQYTDDGNQGPWSDIYALASVLFRAVTGEKPPDAVRRLKSDTVRSSLTAARTRFSARFLNAIESGMNRDEKLRPQSVSEWREQFRGGPAATAQAPRPAVAPAQRPPATGRSPAASASNAGTRKAAEGGQARAARVSGNDSPAATTWGWMRPVAIVLLAGIPVLLYLRHPAPDRDSRQFSDAPQRELPAPANVQQPVPPNRPPDAPGDVDMPRAPMMEFEAADRDSRQVYNVPPREFHAPANVQRPVPPYGPPDASGDADIPRAPMREFKAADRDSRQIYNVPPREFHAPANVQPPVPPYRPPDASGDADIPHVLMKEFRAADRNGDGYLTPDEVRGRFPFIEANFPAVDADGDGRISPRELWHLRRSQRPLKQH